MDKGNEKKDVVAVALIPHKSFEKIKDEYGVEWKKEDLIKLADLLLEGNMNDAVSLLTTIALDHNLPEDKMKNFIKDTLRTAMFYIKALEKVKEIIGDQYEG